MFHKAIAAASGLLVAAGIVRASCSYPSVSSGWAFDVYSNYDCGYNSTEKHYSEKSMSTGCDSCVNLPSGISGILGSYVFTASSSYEVILYNKPCDTTPTHIVGPLIGKHMQSDTNSDEESSHSFVVCRTS